MGEGGWSTIATHAENMPKSASGFQISWHSEALDMSFHGGRNAYITLKGAGCTITWVICWYQLFDGEWELVLWGVFVRPTSRL